MTMTVIGAEDIVVARVPLFHAVVNERPRVTTLDVSGGFGDFRYAVAPAAVFDVAGGGGECARRAGRRRGIWWRRCRFWMRQGEGWRVTALVTVRFANVGELGFAKNPVTVAVGHDYTGVVFEVTVSGGGGGYDFAVVGTMDVLNRGLGFAVDGAGVLNLANALVATSTVSVVVQVTDGTYRSLAPVSLTVVVRTGGTAEWVAISTAVVAGAATGTQVANLVLRDYSAATVRTVLDDLFGFDGDSLELAASPTRAGVLLATAVGG